MSLKMFSLKTEEIVHSIKINTEHMTVKDKRLVLLLATTLILVSATNAYFQVNTGHPFWFVLNALAGIPPALYVALQAKQFKTLLKFKNT